MYPQQYFILSKFSLLLLIFSSLDQAFSLDCWKCESKDPSSLCFQNPHLVNRLCFSVNSFRNNLELPLLDSSVSQSQLSKEGNLDHNSIATNDDAENDCGSIEGYDIYRILHVIRGCLDKRFTCEDYARAYKQQQGFTVTQCIRCGTQKCNTHIL